MRSRAAALSTIVALAVVLGACSKDKPAGLPPLPPRGSAAAIAQAPRPTPKAPPRPADVQHVTIKALGMYCEESCPIAVRYALQDNTNVYELGFDPANESIFVSYDKTLGTPKEVTKPMLEAIKKAGFDPWLAKESWPSDAEVQVVLR